MSVFTIRGSFMITSVLGQLWRNKGPPLALFSAVPYFFVNEKQPSLALDIDASGQEGHQLFDSFK